MSSPATVGVAETSAPVVNTHFALSEATLLTPIVVSFGWLRLLFRFCPISGHCAAESPSSLHAAKPKAMSAAVARKKIALCFIVPPGVRFCQKDSRGRAERRKKLVNYL